MRAPLPAADARRRHHRVDQLYYWLGITIASAAIAAVGPMAWLVATTP